MKRSIAFVMLSALAGAAFAGAPEAPKDNYVGGLLEYLAKPDSNIKDFVSNGYGLDLLYGDRRMDLLPIGYEFHLFSNTTKIKDTFGGGSFDRTGIGADATYPFAVGNGFTPFVLGGLGVEQFKSSGSSSETKSFFEIGAGTLWAIPDSANWRVRADLRYTDAQTDPNMKDLWFKVGVEYGFGGAAASKPAEERVGVVAPVEKAPEVVPEAAPAPAPAPAPEPAHEAAPKKVIALKGVQFASGSDQLKPTSAAALDDAVKTLNGEFPDAKVEVAGHTDNGGDAAKNKALSKRRAQAVVDYLVQHGVDASRLTAEGYGSEQPVADNATKAGRAKNRRVELRVK